jgi:hypothetical protein
MKTPNQILSHLKHQPQFSKLARFECIKKIKSLFSPHLQKMIRYGYINQNTLFFVLNHPGAKQEFDNIIDSIKMPLKLYPPQECSESSFDDIKAYVSYKPANTLKPHITPKLIYSEKSKAAFSNTIKDKKLFEHFETIRKKIESNL